MFVRTHDAGIPWCGRAGLGGKNRFNYTYKTNPFELMIAYETHTIDINAITTSIILSYRTDVRSVL